MGRLRLLGRFEYRHTFVRDLGWNLGHLWYLRGIGGTLFADDDAAAAGACDGYALGRDGVYFDAGYSIKAYYDHLGVSQGTISLDVAVPLNRHARPCLDAGAPQSAVEGRPRVGVYLNFYPPF